MNNLKTYSILDDGYSSYFGFTEKEVKDMLRYYGKMINIMSSANGTMDIVLAIQKSLIHGL